MRLEIDNFDGAGVCDYTAWMDAEKRPKIVRKLNEAAAMVCAVTGSAFVVPVNGARIALRKDSGVALFTGYLAGEAEREYLGWSEAGPVYRYLLSAVGDEAVLDRSVIPLRPTAIQRSAGEVLALLAGEVASGFDTSGTEACDVISSIDAELTKWSDVARAVANQTRSAYSLLDGKIVLRPIGERAFTLSEKADEFSPERLKLLSPGAAIDEVTVVGGSEADAYVKDYFLGDGYSLRYYLSETPFGQKTTTVLQQEYTDPLDPVWWTITDPKSATLVNSGSLWIQGGDGADGDTAIAFAEQVELGGALMFQHGDVTFQGPSDGVIGGLYNGAIAIANCVAGFRVTKAGDQSTISALVNGLVAGQSLMTQIGHRYLLTSRIFATEAVRSSERYHSSAHPAGAAIGGEVRTADLRIVLEVHDVDLNNTATLMTPAIVLYDGVFAGGPAFVKYALVNATDMHCSIAFTRVLQMPDVVVRSASPGASWRTRLFGAMLDGAECNVTAGDLQFFSNSPPAANEQIVAEYRSGKRASARVNIPPTPKEGEGGAPRSRVVSIVSPAARTSQDCANAAQAMLDDWAEQAWSGEYETWSDFLPEGADDLWPGDVLKVDAASRGCEAEMIIWQTTVEAVDPENDRSWYAVQFANEAAKPVAIETRPATSAETAMLANMLDPEIFTLDGLPQAQVTSVTSTAITIDTGIDPVPGGGFEVRRSDSGWSVEVDRNLAGRFNTRVITLPRLARVQGYWIRQYDNSSSRRYSRCATLLHVDYPL